MQVWQPGWTTAVKIESGGRYPLGLNRFHNGLEEILIKSITVLANRLRYYTYCCWAIGDIERHESCQNWADFVHAFQKRETALAMGLYLLQPGYSVPGSEKIAKVANDEADSQPCDFSIMQSNDLGAFGLYYIGTSYSLGLTERNENGVVVLTESGQKLYEIAERRYRKLKPTYYTNYRGKSPVPTAVLREWGQVNDFDNIRDDECQAERVFFQSLLFRLELASPGDYRRDTLAFFLTCIDHCHQSGTAFDENVLSNIHLYRCYQQDSGAIIPFEVPKQFEDVHFYWAIYEGHAYFRVWLSRLFQLFLNYLKGCPQGGTVAEFLDEIDTAHFNEAITDFCGTEANWLDGNMGDVLQSIGAPPHLTDPFSEVQLTADDQYTTFSGVLAKFVLVMAALWLRFQAVRNDQRYKFVAMNLSHDLWFDVLFQLPTLHQMPVRQFLRKMLQSYVLNQHDWIMMQKNDLRRCWFITEQGRYFFQADTTEIWRPAKYSTIMNFLHDMNLIELSVEESWRLTEEGRTLLRRVEAMA
ncbi:MAG: hypothetical protein D6706_16830 [Chloroflexi bacterium]|nr:MAG: hypothetical protein D6706_16830 [Chloroflexota bacterium]